MVVSMLTCIEPQAAPWCGKYRFEATEGPYGFSLRSARMILRIMLAKI
jgi:hypothetical protein